MSRTYEVGRAAWSILCQRGVEVRTVSAVLHDHVVVLAGGYTVHGGYNVGPLVDAVLDYLDPGVGRNRVDFELERPGYGCEFLFCNVARYRGIVRADDY